MLCETADIMQQMAQLGMTVSFRITEAALLVEIRVTAVQDLLCCFMQVLSSSM